MIEKVKEKEKKKLTMVMRQKKRSFLPKINYLIFQEIQGISNMERT